MDELFKKLYEGKELPKDLKKEVMKSYDTLRLFGDIADLFTDKFVKTQTRFLDADKDEKDDRSTDDDKKG